MKKYIVFLFLILTVILTICPIFAAETERRDSTANFPWAHNNAPITRLPAVSSQLVKKNLKEGHSAICETGSPV